MPEKKCSSINIVCFLDPWEHPLHWKGDGDTPDLTVIGQTC